MNLLNSKWVMGHKITPHETSGDYDMVLAETPAQVSGPPPHLHYSYTESFLVVEGEMEFFVDGKTKTIKAGESLDVPPNTLHTFSNRSNKPCKWINVHSPKGFRDFFEEIGVSVQEPDAQERSVAPEVVQKVIRSAADYDMNVFIWGSARKVG